ncbi:MAG: hypothetical protein AAGI68_11395 [Planctomycetota bacterium]
MPAKGKPGEEEKNEEVDPLLHDRDGGIALDHGGAAAGERHNTVSR